MISLHTYQLCFSRIVYHFYMKLYASLRFMASLHKEYQCILNYFLMICQSENFSKLFYYYIMYNFIYLLDRTPPMIKGKHIPYTRDLVSIFAKSSQHFIVYIVSQWDSIISLVFSVLCKIQYNDLMHYDLVIEIHTIFYRANKMYQLILSQAL